MKTKEELNERKKEAEIMSKELTDEELKRVTGGTGDNIELPLLITTGALTIDTLTGAPTLITPGTTSDTASGITPGTTSGAPSGITPGTTPSAIFFKAKLNDQQ